MSKYKYGKKSDRRRVSNQTLETVAEEVAYLRERLDTMNDLLEEISELSTSVREEIVEIENSVAVLEELV